MFLRKNFDLIILMVNLGVRKIYLCTNNSPQRVKSLKIKSLIKEEFPIEV